MSYLYPFLHLEFLWAQCSPWWSFLTGPSLIGAVFPCLLTLWFIQKMVQRLMHRKSAIHWPLVRLLFAFWLAALIMENAFSSWHDGSLSFFPASEVLWPLLAFLLPSESFPRFYAYPLTYLAALPVDLYHGGMHFHWNAPLWWIGVGGAGVKDGLFLTPLITVVIAYGAGAAGAWFRRHGYFQNEIDAFLYSERN